MVIGGVQVKTEEKFRKVAHMGKWKYELRRKKLQSGKAGTGMHGSKRGGKVMCWSEK